MPCRLGNLTLFLISSSGSEISVIVATSVVGSTIRIFSATSVKVTVSETLLVIVAFLPVVSAIVNASETLSTRWSFAVVSVSVIDSDVVS